MNLKLYFLLGLALSAILMGGARPAASLAAQTRPQDRPVTRVVRFAPGESAATYKARIRPGISHRYTVEARAGQTMEVILTTRGRTSFTVSVRRAGILADADGVQRWAGELPETGTYTIEIGTDTAADYALDLKLTSR